jgi:hypothetical protein
MPLKLQVRFRQLCCQRLVQCLGALVILTFSGPIPSLAAVITNVPDAIDTVIVDGEQQTDLFDLYAGAHLALQWHSGKILREPIDQPGVTSACSEATPRNCIPVDELSWRERSILLNLRMEVGIFRDLALTIALPIVISRTLGFDYANQSALNPAERIDASTSTVDGNTFPQIFPHDFATKQGGLGPMELGFKWGILNDERDATKATWVLSAALAAPWTTQTFDPTITDGTSGQPAPVGDGVYRLTFGMANSKRMGEFGEIGINQNIDRRGYTEPYIGLFYTYPMPTKDSPKSLRLGDSSNKFGARPSHVGSIAFGFEILPYESQSKGHKISLDLGFRSKFVSEGRNYTVLTDPLNELTYTEQYFIVGGHFGLLVHLAHYIQLSLAATLSYVTEHFLTYENVGTDNSPEGSPGFGQVIDPQQDPTSTDEINPYFSTSHDQIGFRFKNSSQFHIDTRFSVVITF